MRGAITLNYDGRFVVLDIEPPDADSDGAMNLKLQTQYKTPEIAQAMAAIMARRMGLRKRGSGWHKRVR